MQLVTYGVALQLTLILSSIRETIIMCLLIWENGY